MDVLLNSLLLVLEGIVPGKRHRVDMILVRGDREARLDSAEGSKVLVEEIAAGGEGIGDATLELGAELPKRFEVVLEALSLPLGVVDDDEVAERAVEVNRHCLLLVDC